MSTARTTTALRTRWMSALVSLVGAFEVLMAVSAGPALIRVVGVAGGLALAAAPWAARRSRGVAVLLLVIGTVPFVARTVSSLVAPVLTVVAWILMGLILRAEPRLARPTARVPEHPAHQAGSVAT